MEFKVGDRVKNKIYGIGTVRYIDVGDSFPYAIEFDNYNNELHDCGLWKESTIKCGYGYWYDDYDLELLETKPFTKSDLKEGDRLTLRDGSIRIHKINNKYLIDAINEDLTNSGGRGKDYDIVKAERPTYTTIYEREEEAKEMTVAEISKALGYEVKIAKGEK